MPAVAASAATVTSTATTSTTSAVDTFSRDVTGGLGAADRGGTWLPAQASADFSVAGGAGRIRLGAPGSGRLAHLDGISSSSGEVRVTVALDKTPTGGGTYVSVIGRRVGTVGDYRLKLRARADGKLVASLMRVLANQETTLKAVTLSSATLTTTKPMQVRLKVTGTAPTALAAKVWNTGAAEPASWQLSGTDSTSGLQTSGSVGVAGYLSASATNAPVMLAFDDVWAGAPDGHAAYLASLDTTPPETTIRSGPDQGVVVTSTSASFGLSSSEAGSFQCRLDGSAWRSCASPATYSNLSHGSHVLDVRAVDGAGNVDATPASRAWTVVAATPGVVQPGAANTGVPAGTSLRTHVGDLVVTVPGTVIDGLDIHGFVKIQAENVTVRRSIVRGRPVTTQSSLVHSTAKGFVIEDSELVAAHPSPYVDGLKGHGFTARRLNIHGVVDTALIYGSNSRIESSWLHDNLHYEQDPMWGGKPSHDDSIQVQGGSNIRLVGNNISGAKNAGLQITQDRSATSDLQFSRNWADGGACTVNVAEKGRGPIQGLVLQGNIFGRNTRHYDCAIIAPTTTPLVAAKNVWADTRGTAQVRKGS
jgi:hypothetical protein